MLKFIGRRIQVYTRRGWILQQLEIESCLCKGLFLFAGKGGAEDEKVLLIV